MVAARQRRLGRVTLVPELADDRPPDLELEVAVELLVHRVHPALGIPKEIADPPQELLVLLANDAQQADPMSLPLPEHALDRLWHVLGRQRRPAQEADDLGIAPECDVAGAIAELRLAEEEALRLEPHARRLPECVG